jgi:hypothetical protein
MEDYLVVKATNERLRPIHPKRIFNTDEKPCVLSKIHGSTIVFGDVLSPVFVPQQKRETNCTLVITSRGDGKVVGLMIILPSSVKKLDSRVLDVLQKHCDLDITVTDTKTGFRFVFCKILNFFHV